MYRCRTSSTWPRYVSVELFTILEACPVYTKASAQCCVSKTLLSPPGSAPGVSERVLNQFQRFHPLSVKPHTCLQGLVQCVQGFEELSIILKIQTNFNVFPAIETVNKFSERVRRTKCFTFKCSDRWRQRTRVRKAPASCYWLPSTRRRS